MDAVQTFYFLLSSFVHQLPEFIAIIIGIIICFTRLRNFPKTSKIALGGFFILLIMALIGVGMTLFYVYLPLWYRESMQTITYINFAIALVFSFIRAVGLGLIILAIWTERGNDRIVKN